MGLGFLPIHPGPRGPALRATPAMHSIWMVLIFTTSKFSVDACPSLTYKKIKNIYPMTKATCGPIIVTEKSITVNF